MYVYRIENPYSGEGPYQWPVEYNPIAFELYDEINNAHGVESILYISHPNMYMDTKAPRHEWMYAACASIEQLAEWFSGFMLRLHNAGYVLRIYDAQEVYTGTYQVCFNKLSAELVDEMSITDALATLN